MLLTLIRILFVLILSFSISFWANYKILLGKKESEAKENIKAISAIMDANFEQTERILVFIGEQIAEKTPELNLEKIYKIFVQASYSQGFGDIFSWSLFDWVNAKGYQSVNTIIGIRDNPPFLAGDRTYDHPANESWKAIFSYPAIGNPSGLYVIPVGVQIETKNHRAGAVVVGISIKKLVNLIMPRLTKNSRFVVINERSEELIFGSHELKNNFETYLSDSSLVYHDNKYLVSEKISLKYPYIIKAGYDKKEFWQEVRASSLILSLQIIGAAMVVLMFRRQFFY